MRPRAAKGGAAAGIAGAITVTTATPKRVSARLELALEDIAAVGQANFESILRENLSLALSDELDKQAINGDGQAPNLTGILQRLGNPADPTAIADFDAFVAAFANGVDGLWAGTMGEVAIVGGVSTYRLSAETFRDPSTGTAGGRGAMAFSDYAMQHTGGWWTNKRMPDADARQLPSGDPVPQGPLDDGRGRGDANGRLSALERNLDRRHLFRQREGRALLHDARPTRRRDPGAAGRLRAGCLSGSVRWRRGSWRPASRGRWRFGLTAGR